MAKANYEAKLLLLEEILTGNPPSPHMPADKAAQEAENLYVWVQADKEAFLKINFDWKKWVDDLSVRSGALRYAQSLWVSERNAQEEAQKAWEADSPGAYELRDDLLATFRYAFRKRNDLLGRVREISQGTGHEDMIQDLSDLSALGKNNIPELKEMNFDMPLLDKAATRAEKLADMLALANGAREDNSRAKRIRDAAFAHVKEAVDEIRISGKFLFRK